jgi:hypothetical protein
MISQLELQAILNGKEKKPAVVKNEKLSMLNSNSNNLEGIAGIEKKRPSFDRIARVAERFAC